MLKRKQKRFSLFHIVLGFKTLVRSICHNGILSARYWVETIAKSMICLNKLQKQYTLNDKLGFDVNYEEFK